MKTLNFFKTALMTTACISFFTACNDDDAVQPDTTDYASVSEFYAANKKQADTFILDAASGGQVTASEGTVITFPANAFLDGNGDPVSGNVEVDITEYYSKKDLFYANLPTESNGQWLVTGGSLNLDANQNGTPITLVSSGISAFMPDQTDAGSFKNNMMQFEGQRPNNDPDAPVNWVLADDRQIAYSVSSPVGYTMDDIGQFLRNCDAFYNDPNPKTQFSTTMPGVNDISEASLWLFVDGLATVISITTQNGNQLDTYSNSIPVGVTGTLLAFTTEKGYLEYATQDITVTGNDQFSLAIQPRTQADLDAFLATVD